MVKMTFIFTEYLRKKRKNSKSFKLRDHFFSYFLCVFKYYLLSSCPNLPYGT